MRLVKKQCINKNFSLLDYQNTESEFYSPFLWIGFACLKVAKSVRGDRRLLSYKKFPLNTQYLFTNVKHSFKLFYVLVRATSKKFAGRNALSYTEYFAFPSLSSNRFPHCSHGIKNVDKTTTRNSGDNHHNLMT